MSPAIPTSQPRWSASERAFNGGMRVVLDEVAKAGHSGLFKTCVEMQPDIAWDLADEGFIETKRMLMMEFREKLPKLLLRKLSKERCEATKRGERCTDFARHTETTRDHDFHRGPFA